MTVNTKDREEIKRIKNSAPIFIIGSQRSGTSFLYRLIQNYLKIGFGRDNANFVKIQSRIEEFGDLKNEKNLKRLINYIKNIPEFKKRFRGLEIDVDAFIERLEKRTYDEIVRNFYAEWAFFKQTIRWGGKTPDYAIYAPELFGLFPDAKFVHIIRDGRDVALSLFNLPWGAQNTVVAAIHWKERVEKARNFGKTLSDKNYLEIRYENLLRDPKKEFERLIYFIEYEGDKAEIIKQFNSEIDNLIMKNNFFKWKKEMSPRQVKNFERYAGNLLKELDYEIKYPDELNKPVSKLFLFRNHFYNLFNKGIRGQGFAGLWKKTYRFFYDLWLKFK